MNKKYIKIGLAVIIVLVLIVAAFALYFYNNPSKVPCMDGGKRVFVGGSGWKCYPKDTKIVPM